MSLVTRCPKCHADFAVKLEQLQALDGLVRCGACAHIFDGFASLQSQLPTLTQRLNDTQAGRAQSSSPPSNAEPFATRSVGVSSVSEPSVLRHRAGRPDSFGGSESEEVSEFFKTPEPSLAREPLMASAPSVSADDTEPSLFRRREHASSDAPILGEPRLRGDGALVGRTQPDFLVDEVDTPRLMMLLWGLASALALALLVVQLAYVYRNDLATSVPALRPALESLCAKLKCEVSLKRHLERISVSVIAFERQAGSGPEAQSASMSLKFSLRNRMNQAQPWPHLSLELADASGTVVLRKRLSPDEYLPKAFLDKPFGPNQEVSLALPVTVTGLQINGYTLKPFFP